MEHASVMKVRDEQLTTFYPLFLFMRSLYLLFTFTWASVAKVVFQHLRQNHEEICRMIHTLACVKRF